MFGIKIRQIPPNLHVWGTYPISWRQLYAVRNHVSTLGLVFLDSVLD